MIDLQRRRQQRGWYFYDWANSAFSTTVGTVFLGPYLTNLANDAADAGQPVTLLGLVSVAPGAYIAFVISLSVLLQVVTMPIVGAIADNAQSKRRILGVTAFLGAAATMALFLVQNSYQLGGVLFIIANVAFGCSVVVYNSFLPDIATPEERNAVSSRGWALGYVGGIVLLVGILASIFQLSRRMQVQERRATQSALLATVIACLFNCALYDALIGDYLCVTLALCLAAGLKPDAGPCGPRKP